MKTIQKVEVGKNPTANLLIGLMVLFQSLDMYTAVSTALQAALEITTEIILFKSFKLKKKEIKLD